MVSLDGRHVCNDIASTDSAAASMAEAMALEESRTQWKAWTAKVAAGGARLAHSWTKETVNWVQQVAKDAVVSLSPDPNDILRQLHSSWHHGWVA